MSTLQASVPHEGLAIKSISSLFLQCFTNHSCNAKESTSTILTVAHIQVISPKDSQGCQIATTWETEEGPSDSKETGISFFFIYHQVLRSGSAKQETCVKELPLCAIAVPGMGQVRRALWNSRLSRCSYLGPLIYKDFSRSLERTCTETLCSQPESWGSSTCTYQQ